MIFINDVVGLEKTISLLFELVDDDDDGRLECADIAKLLRRANVGAISDKQILDFFHEMGPDEQGFVLKKEFIAFMRAHPELLTNQRKTKVCHTVRSFLD